MTLKDQMPFGKFKGLPLSEVPKDYIRWLKDQDWFTDQKGRWREVYILLCGTPEEVKTIATSDELKRDSIEDEVLARADEDFRAWWERQYGKRLRDAKSPHYVTYLRLTLEAWLASRQSLTGPADVVDQSPSEPEEF